jgi:Glyoxalase superfamily protein
MHTHHDAKTIAKILKDECDQRGLKLTHSDSLEIVAKQFGLKNWNVLAALIGDKSAIGAADATGPAAELVIPKGWRRGGREPRLYDIGVPAGGGLMTIRRQPGSGADTAGSFGSLFQIISADAFAGKAVKLTAEVSTVAVDGTAAIWVRMDDASGNMVAFDDLQRQLTDRSLTGSADWTGQVVVLSVPPAAHSIHFGFYLSGFGTAYARNFQLIAVEVSGATSLAASQLPSAPANLQLQVA